MFCSIISFFRFGDIVFVGGIYTLVFFVERRGFFGVFVFFYIIEINIFDAIIFSLIRLLSSGSSSLFFLFLHQPKRLSKYYVALVVIW